MIPTPEALTDKIPLDVGTLGTLKNPSEVNLLSQFSELLDVTKKNYARRMGYAKKSERPHKQSVLYDILFISRNKIKNQSTCNISSI